MKTNPSCKITCFKNEFWKKKHKGRKRSKVRTISKNGISIKDKAIANMCRSAMLH